MEDKYKARINFHGDLKDVSMLICKDYNLGEFKSNEIILIGYEDFNFILETSKGKYFVKTFANFRKMDDCKRYIDIMEKAMEAKIATPKLIKSKKGYLYITEINNTKLRLCVMEFIDGKNLFESREKLNDMEIKFISNQAALINSLKIKPNFIYDRWAIVNFLKEFEEKGKSLSNDDLKILKPLINEFKQLNIEKLPHCFVHGDIIAPNVIKDKYGKLWIIDFSVSNYYPRVQELAVLACNLYFNEDSKEKTIKNLEIALKEYQKIIKLTEEELSILPLFIKLAHAMHVLCAGFEKNIRNNTSIENEYFLNQGRIGLKQTQA